MKVKKIILSLDAEYSLFGIKTNVPSYKLVYFLNKELKISFKREKDIVFIENKKNIYLNKYCYYDSGKEQDWTLVANEKKCEQSDLTSPIFRKSENLYTLKYLVPEFKMFNYIIKIEGVLTKKNEKIKKMNNILVVNIASEIKQSLIKNKDKLLF